MNPTIRTPAGKEQQIATAQTKGFSPRLLAVSVAMIVLGIFLSILALRRPVASPPTDSQAEAPNQSEAEGLVLEQRGPAEPQRQTTGVEKSAVPNRNTISPGTTKVEAAAPLPESARPTQQILNSLMEANLGQSLLSPDQAAALNTKMQEIVAQGSRGVPAIRELLDRNVDLMFAEAQGGNTLQYNSLRSGLLDALRKIGDPEAIAVSRHVLETTADPGEIAQLARNLESIAPGEYRQDVLNAAREALALAAKGELGNRDVGPVFQVLQEFGDASIVSVLEDTAPQFRYYSILALAGLPEGEGIPSLIQMAQSNDRTRSTLSDFALLMLAQVADQSPEAQKALIEQAQGNKITDSVWRLVGNSLAGEQKQIGQLPPEFFSQVGVAMGADMPGFKNFRNDSNNQNFYSVPGWQTWSDQQVNQRIALIDQLLAGNNNPAAIQSLQRARATLSALPPVQPP